MTISIVGCGWLGLPLSEFLMQKSIHIKGSTTTPTKLITLEDKGIQPFLLDLRSITLSESDSLHDNALSEFFRTDILYINIPPDRRNPNILQDYPAWINFLAKKCEVFKIKKVIFVGSTGVYPNFNRIVTEETTPSSETNSQKAIVIAEQILQENKNFETTILRLAGLVGKNRIPARWFAGKKNVTGKNTPVNLVHLEDCIGVSYAVIKNDVFGETFNICADEHPTKEEFYTHQAKKYNLGVPTFSDKLGHTFKIVSNEKSKVVLNYKYKRPNPMQF